MTLKVVLIRIHTCKKIKNSSTSQSYFLIDATLVRYYLLELTEFPHASCSYSTKKWVLLSMAS